MKSALIITTYNRPDALHLVLKSVQAQSRPVDEIIIADDGSGTDTKDCISSWQKKLETPIIHSWQEDKGFRAARSRNLAISQTQAEYLIIIDGDMVLHPHFIRSHQIASRPGQFIQGSRVLLSPLLTKHALIKEQIRFSAWEKGVRNRFNAIHLPALSKTASATLRHHRGVRSCNMSFWRSDAVKINGFNEAFIGWGREDSEFVVRLLNAGLKRYQMKLSGVAYHLSHGESNKEETREMLPANDAILARSIEEKLVWCEQGLS